MANNRQGLGKGFEALLPSNFNKDIMLSPEEKIIKIELNKLSPNPNQPRSNFNESALKELASSIKRYGVIQPILAMPNGKEKYVIIAGERRFRAAKIAGLDKIPAVVKQRKELEQIEIALIENIQREDLNPLEQAYSIEKLKQQFNFSVDEIAKRMGKANSTITNLLRLVSLPESAKKALMENKIVEGHARQIVSIKDNPEMQEFLLKEIINKNWNVRQAEQFVSSLKEGVKEAKEASKRTSKETTETKVLAKKLGTAVTIRRMAHGGKLEITYKDDSDLERIINSFK